MKTLIGWIIVAASLFFGLRPAHANYVYGEFGLAFDHKYEHQYSQVKQVEFGHVAQGRTFERTLAVGLWTDISSPEVRSSTYVQYLIGLEPRRADRPYWYYMIGPAFVTYPDAFLGSHFEVAHEAGWGAVDSRGVRIGFYIKHYSDGGLSKRNEGRNFVGMRAGF